MSDIAADAVFSAALQHHRQGRLAEALSFYRNTLIQAPNHTGALFNMAALFAQAGEPADAITLYNAVLQLKPEDPDTLCNLGNLAASQGDLPAAETYYRRALARRPHQATVLLNLGNICLQQNKPAAAAMAFTAALANGGNPPVAEIGLGVSLMRENNFTDARAHFEAALALDPTDADGHANLGIILTAVGEADAAIAHYQAALASEPDRAQCHFNLGVLLAERRQRALAMRHYRRALALAPDDVPTLRNLARLIHDRGRFQMAMDLLQRAEAIAPNDANVQFDLGNMWHGKQKLDLAEAHYRRALAIDPAGAETHSNLGSVLLALGDIDGAVAAQRQAIALKPDFVYAYNNLGNALGELGQLEAARAAYQQAIDLDPDFAFARINLGNTLRLLGRYAEAATILQRAIELAPRLAAAHNNYGLLMHVQSRHDEALAAFQQAIECEPGHAEALNNIAICYQTQGRFGDAIRCYRDLIALYPDRPPTYVNLGGALQLLGRYDESVITYQKALDIQPDYHAAYPYLAHGLMQQCSWSNLDATVAKMLRNAEAELASGQPVSVSCFGLMSTPAPMALRAKVAMHVADRAASQVAEIKRTLNFVYRRHDGRKLRVGYLSPDFRFHSVAVAFRGLLEAHDRENFEFCGYSLAPLLKDTFTEFFRQSFHRFRDVSALSFRDAAQQIYDDGIDILIDLAGHTRFCRPGILALQPAPVQAHYLGYSSTIGGDFLQYLITDHRQISPGAEAYFTEKLVYLPDTFMATTRAPISPEPVTRADFGLPEQGFVFCNFNAHYKFEPTLFGIWMRLLKRRPGSVLWLMNGTPSSDRNLMAEAERRGIDPARLVFSAKSSHSVHLARHRLADLALDTLHHGGGVTTVDALWVGVPVVTVAGESPPARNGASLLHAIGLDELIADSIDDYERIAQELATQPAHLAAIKARLIANRDVQPLFDTERLTRHLESAYRRMWTRWRDGLPPESFDVAEIPSAATLSAPA